MSGIEFGRNILRIGVFCRKEEDCNVSGFSGTMAYNFFSFYHKNYKFPIFDVLFIAGGDAEKQNRDLGKNGRKCIVDFVKFGGGFISTCAGSYLALTHDKTQEKEQLKWVKRDIIDTTTESWHYGMVKLTSTDLKNWGRGEGDVDIEYTDFARKNFGCGHKSDVFYANGPIFKTLPNTNFKDGTDFNVIAWFRSEKAKKPESVGKMKDTPAMVCAPFGLGRVVLSSCHPDTEYMYTDDNGKQCPGFDGFNFLKMMFWCGRKEKFIKEITEEFDRVNKKIFK